MGRLYQNLNRMSNTEINNLAKNEFTDDVIRVWIATHSHVQARYYLAEKTLLCDEVVEILVAGKSNIVKGILVSTGAVKDSDTIRSIYEKCTHFCEWRIHNYFVENYWSRRGDGSHNRDDVNTPPDVLESIYENSIQKRYHPYLRRSIVKHRNCSIKLALRMTMDPDSTTRNLAFQTLARVEQQTC